MVHNNRPPRLGIADGDTTDSNIVAEDRGCIIATVGVYTVQNQDENNDFLLLSFLYLVI